MTFNNMFPQILVTLVAALVVAVVTQMILQFSGSRVQAQVNKDHEKEHESMKEDCMAESKRQSENLKEAVAIQKETSARMELAVVAVITEQKETNRLLQTLVGTMNGIVVQQSNSNDRMNFFDARLRDLERLTSELKGRA